MIDRRRVYRSVMLSKVLSGCFIIIETANCMRHRLLIEDSKYLFFIKKFCCFLAGKLCNPLTVSVILKYLRIINHNAYIAYTTTLAICKILMSWNDMIAVSALQQHVPDSARYRLEDVELLSIQSDQRVPRQADVGAATHHSQSSLAHPRLRV